MGLIRSFEVASPAPLFIFFLLLLHLLLLPSTCDGRAMLCRAREREALIHFRDGLSWNDTIIPWGEEEEDDCCSWIGIGCDNHTGHVVSLDLRGGVQETPGDNYAYGVPLLRGKISPSLAVLKYLRRLDLSGNDFEGSSIPPFFGSFERLMYLDLSYANFSGVVPQHLGNLSGLWVLTLSDIYMIESDGEWLSRLYKLRCLHLRFTNLTGVDNLLKVLNMLPFLESLHLYFARGSDTTLSYLLHVNFTRLAELSIIGLNITNACWLSEITSLEYLHLESNYMQIDACRNDFTAKLCNLKSLTLQDNNMGMMVDLNRFFRECNHRMNLTSLDLSGNSFTGQLPGWLGDYKSLESLSLIGDNLRGSIPESIGGMTCLKELFLSSNLAGSIPQSISGLRSLQYLSLSGNNIMGTIPESIGGLRSLEDLDLSDNNMSGPLPSSLWELKSLQVLQLDGNHFQGNLSEEHFVHLANLTIILLSCSPLLQVTLSPHWVPPFNLTWLDLGSCKLGPDFPLWLQTQNKLERLNMSDAGISDVFPQWIWNFSSNLQYLDLSVNNLTGIVPAAPKSFAMVNIILHSNRLQGSLLSFPRTIHVALFLSNNLFSGPIDIDMSRIETLSLSNNSFIGDIPLSLCKAEMLRYLDLSHNRLSGQLPSCSADHTCGLMTTLHLNNNSLNGTIPSWLWNCTQMDLLDMGENNFSGGIPGWISNSMPQLKVLRLRSNSFNGLIPMELPNLASLHVLDLAGNNFSGPIPPTIGNFSAMKIPLSGNEALSEPGVGYYYQESIMVASKGNVQQEPESILKLFTSIDLSGNKLSGDIPSEVGRLVCLKNLNLSHNLLNGCIPETFAKLSQLESLDLSCNNVTGEIPQTLPELTYLNSFNVSFNNLSGRIPSGRQFNTFTNSSYMGNFDLCGKPLQVVCESDLSPPITQGYAMQTDQKDDHYYFLWLSVSVVLGFIMGFWTFLGTLFFKSNWRHAYFELVDDLCEKYYLLAKIYIDKCRRMCRRS